MRSIRLDRLWVAVTPARCGPRGCWRICRYCRSFLTLDILCYDSDDDDDDEDLDEDVDVDEDKVDSDKYDSMMMT